MLQGSAGFRPTCESGLGSVTPKGLPRYGHGPLVRTTGSPPRGAAFGALTDAATPATPPRSLPA